MKPNRNLPDLLNLTTKQTAILRFIEDSMTHNYRPPTIREIGTKFGFQSTGTTRGHLAQLNAKGFIKLNRRQARSIELINYAPFKIPILGNITAGTPNLATEDSKGSCLDLERILPTRNENTFALKIIGDSMIEKGIHEGDIAIIRKQPDAQHNDIIAALIENEATVKILKIHHKTASLMPANKNYAQINKPFSIIGKVIAIIRQFY